MLKTLILFVVKLHEYFSREIFTVFYTCTVGREQGDRSCSADMNKNEITFYYDFSKISLS